MGNPPPDVGRGEILRSGELLTNTEATLQRLLLGFVLGGVPGLAVGIVHGDAVHGDAVTATAVVSAARAAVVPAAVACLSLLAPVQVPALSDRLQHLPRHH